MPGLSVLWLLVSGWISLTLSPVVWRRRMLGDLFFNSMQISLCFEIRWSSHLNWEDVWLYWLAKWRTLGGQAHFRCFLSCPQSSLFRKLPCDNGFKAEEAASSGLHLRESLTPIQDLCVTLSRGRISHTSPSEWLSFVLPVSTSASLPERGLSWIPRLCCSFDHALS